MKVKQYVVQSVEQAHTEPVKPHKYMNKIWYLTISNYDTWLAILKLIPNYLSKWFVKNAFVTLNSTQIHDLYSMVMSVTLKLLLHIIPWIHCFNPCQCSGLQTLPDQTTLYNQVSLLDLPRSSVSRWFERNISSSNNMSPIQSLRAQMGSLCPLLYLEHMLLGFIINSVL